MTGINLNKDKDNSNTPGLWQKIKNFCQFLYGFLFV